MLLNYDLNRESEGFPIHAAIGIIELDSKWSGGLIEMVVEAITSLTMRSVTIGAPERAGIISVGSATIWFEFRFLFLRFLRVV